LKWRYQFSAGTPLPSPELLKFMTAVVTSKQTWQLYRVAAEVSQLRCSNFTCRLRVNWCLMNSAGYINGRHYLLLGKTSECLRCAAVRAVG